MTDAKINSAKERLKLRKQGKISFFRRTDPKKAIELSSNQRRLWFLDKYENNPATYLVPLCFRLQGAVDIKALESGINALMRRHEILRTAFVDSEAGPQQVVLSELQTHVRQEKVAADTPERRMEIGLGIISAMSREVFDLSRPPLLRAALVELDAKDFLFGLSLHHIVCDAWSLSIFFKELRVLYESAATGTESALPELEYQFGDFSEWERIRFESNELDRTRAYWRQKLAGQLPVLDLGCPRPAQMSFRGSQEDFSLNHELMQQVKTFAELHGTTPFAILCTTYIAMLARYSRQDEILLGLPVANRPNRKVDQLIGFFSNTVVLRLDIAKHESFSDLLKRVTTTSLEALDNQDMPFDLLVNDLKAQRSLSYSPVFQTMFAMQNTPQDDVFQLPEIQSQAIPIHNGSSKVDLTFSAAIHADNICCSLEYSEDLFDKDFIEAFVKAFEVLLKEALQTPNRSLHSYPLLSKEDSEQVAATIATRVATYRREDFIHTLIEDQVAFSPAATAVIFNQLHYSYETLNHDANRLGRYLLSQGLGSESVVALYLDRSYELVVAMLAVLKAGCTWVPLDVDYPKDRLNYIVKDSGARLILIQERHRSKLADCSAPQLALDEEAKSYSSWSAENLELSINPGQAAYIYYTSGSTGQPKGVIIDHECARNRLDWLRSAYPLTQEDRVLMKTPLIFDVIVWEVYLPLMFGAGIVIVPAGAHADPVQIADLLKNERITFAHFVPSMLQAFLEFESTQDYRALKWVALSGEGCPVATRDRFQMLFQAELHNQYGQTETSEVAFWNCSQGEQPNYVPVGHQVGVYRLYVLDDHLQLLPVGVPGELCVAGNGGLARGYLGRSGLTAERFVPDPYSQNGERIYRTGDLVKRLADGSFKYLGRIDSQVKIRGCRVEVEEVETVISRHPAIQKCVVIARPNASGSLHLLAYVVLRAGFDFPQDLKTHMKSSLADFMLPAAIIPVTEFPQTSSGKVARSLLPDPALRDFDSLQQSHVSPANEIEKEILAIWSAVLDRRIISTDMSFFDLGGDSLKAIRVIIRLNSNFGTSLKVRDMFESQTIQHQATLIQSRMATSQELQLGNKATVTPTSSIPLSFAQKRVWFVEQMHPNLAQYNIGTSFRINKSISHSSLEAAFQVLIDRHESLRTAIYIKDGEPLQKVLPTIAFKVAFHDLRIMENQEHTIQSILHADATKSFSLEHGPLFRSSLLQLTPTEVMVTLVIHHIIADGWSLGILIRELTSILDQRAQTAPTLQAQTFQYRDYILWQMSAAQEAERQRQLQYWLRKLKGSLPVLSLPTNRQRPALPTFEGNLLRFHLPTEKVKALKAIAAAERSTLFMMLLAIYKTLLYRNSGQTEIIVGVPVAGRNRSEFENIIGFFVNTVALRSELVPSDSILALLRQLRDTTIEAQDNQDLPFEVLVDHLKIPREINQNPVFQTMFALQNTPRSTLSIDDQTAVEVDLDTATSKFDLTFSLTEYSEGIEVLVEYSKDLFDQCQIKRLYQQFGYLIEGVIAEPNRSLDSLPILSVAERVMILETWNQSEFPIGDWRSMVQVFESQVLKTPGSPALVYEDQCMSYAEMNRRANQLARHLRNLGVQDGDYVSLSVHRSFAMVIGIYAIQKAGAAYVPIDPTIPLDRISHMIQDSRSRLVIVDRSSAALLNGLEIQRCNVDAMSSQISSLSGENLRIYRQLFDIAYLLYTSGSTGKPKGVAYTHAGSLSFLLWLQETLPLQSNDAVMQKTPFGFDVSVWEFFWPLYVGAKLVIIPPGAHADPQYLGKAIQEHKITVMNFVPSMLQSFVSEHHGYDCDSLRLVLAGGEALTVALCDSFSQKFKAKLVNMYGPTEAGAVSYWVCDPESNSLTVPIGIPCGNFQLYVLDKNLQPVPPMVVGELYIASEYGLAVGYEGKPAMTAEKFLPNPFSSHPGGRMYKTGDLCRFRDDGAIEYLGRSDFQVKIRGVRIELEEIESVLRRHPSVHNCSVQAIKENGETQLVAFIQTGDESMNSTVYRAYLSEFLPVSMLPAQFIMIPEIRTNLNGKTDRAFLLSYMRENPPAEIPTVPVVLSDKLAFKVQKIWCEILQAEPMGLDADFFDIGGNSFKAIKLLVALEESFGIKLTVPFVFTHRTLGRLTYYLRAHNRQPQEPYGSCLVPMYPSDKPLLILIHPVSGSVFPYLGLGKGLASEYSVYGLQAAGIDFQGDIVNSMDSIVNLYAKAVLNVWKSGNIVIGGWSFGGIVALELARHLQEQGYSVRSVFMLDSWLPDATSEAANISDKEISDSLDFLVSLDLVPLEQRDMIQRPMGANMRALAGYKPHFYKGRVHLFKAKDPLPLQRGDRVPFSYNLPSLGWSGWIQSLNILSCEGHHYSLLSDENIPELTTTILNLLTKDKS